MRRTSGITVVAAIFLCTLAGARSIAGGQTPRGAAAAPPAFQVDPLWPKPLPNGWILGSVTGVAVDAQNHVWVAHRGASSLNARTEIGLAGSPPSAEACCLPAPPVLRFDAAGTLVANWGGPGTGYDWPQSPGGLAIDAKGNVWIAAAGPPEQAGGGRGGGAARGGAAGRVGGAAPAAAGPPADAHVLAFTPAGQFVRQIGKAGSAGAPDSTTTLNRPADVDVDRSTNELFVADTGSHRIVVFDAETGAYKRHWGAYGVPPEAPPPGAYDPAAAPIRQFRSLSCVAVSRDGHVYVCDRRNNRVQVFRRDGTFVREAVISKATLGNGSVWDVAFSNDAAQRFLFVADGQNQKVHVLARETLGEASSVGGGGRWPGYFYAVGSVAVDAQGTLYTGETLEGKRVQKFLPRR